MRTFNQLPQEAQNNLTTKLEKLQTELHQALDTPNGNEDFKLICAKINDLELQLKEQKKKERLKVVNELHAKQKDILIEALTIEFPTEDIRTNDLNFHSVKVRKYPTLDAFNKKYPYAVFTYNYKAKKYTHCNLNGKEYRLFVNCYDNQAETMEVFTDLKQACEYNRIQIKNLTFASFKKQEREILAKCKKVQDAIDKLSKDLKETNGHHLDCEGLINSNERHGHVYNYTSI